jgi:hypothetical protein
MRLVPTPYIECHVKKSFLSGKYKLDKDETVPAILIAIRFVARRSPLFIVYLPKLGAVYDKMLQHGIYKDPDTPMEPVRSSDVAWWDCISDNWEICEIPFLRNLDVQLYTQQDKRKTGTYLFTADPGRMQGHVDYGQGEQWHEHKTKSFFFCDDTGVLCCGPNNKMRFIDSSLTPEVLEDPRWLRVYKNEEWTHEESRLGDAGDSFVYERPKSV